MKQITKTPKIKTIPSPELAQILYPIVKLLEGVDYVLAGGACVDVFLKQDEEHTLQKISRDYDFFFESESHYHEAVRRFEDKKCTLDFETENAQTWHINNLLIQLVIPKDSDNQSYKEIIEGFDLMNARMWSFPPFTEVSYPEALEDKKIKISLDYMSFGFVNRVLKYKFKGLDESLVVDQFFDFFMDYNNKDKYPKAFIHSGYDKKEVPKENRGNVAWTAISNLLIHSVPFQLYCRQKEEEGILLPLWRMSDYHLSGLHKTVYRYHGYLKIQHDKKYIDPRQKVVNRRPILDNQEEILDFMKKNYPEIVL